MCVEDKTVAASGLVEEERSEAQGITPGVCFVRVRIRPDIQKLEKAR